MTTKSKETKSKKIENSDKIFLLSFIHHFVQKKLSQTRCSDPFLWSRVNDFIVNEIKEVSNENTK